MIILIINNKYNEYLIIHIYYDHKLLLMNIILVFIIIDIIEKGLHCQARIERFTPWQSLDPSPTVPAIIKIGEEESEQLRPIKKHLPCPPPSNTGCPRSLDRGEREGN